MSTAPGGALAASADVTRTDTANAPISATFAAMGTDVHVVVLVERSDRALDLARVARGFVGRLERRWSRFIDSSDIGRINANPDRPVMVDPTTIDLLDRAIDAWHQTSGRFDPTVGASLRIAGYDRPFVDLAPLVEGGSRPAPSPADVVVHRSACTVAVPSGVELDLGGIGKGEAADLTVRALLAAGAKGAMVNLGGDLRAAGDCPPHGWTVELECPGRAAAAAGWAAPAIRIASGAVCTSSTVKRRWATVDGERHHILEPASGASTDTDCVSATVVGATAAQCEVLATTSIGLGIEGARTMLEAHHTSGLLVDAAGHLHDVGQIGTYR